MEITSIRKQLWHDDIQLPCNKNLHQRTDQEVVFWRFLGKFYRQSFVFPLTGNTDPDFYPEWVFAINCLKNRLLPKHKLRESEWKPHGCITPSLSLHQQGPRNCLFLLITLTLVIIIIIIIRDLYRYNNDFVYLFFYLKGLCFAWMWVASAYLASHSALPE